MASKKNLFLLFLAFGDFVGYLMPQSYADPDIQITSKDYLNSIEDKLLNKISDIEGVENVFGRRSAFDIPAKISSSNKREEKVDLISYDDFDLKALKKDKLLKKI